MSDYRDVVDRVLDGHATTSTFQYTPYERTDPMKLWEIFLAIFGPIFIILWIGLVLNFVLGSIISWPVVVYYLAMSLNEFDELVI